MAGHRHVLLYKATHHPLYHVGTNRRFQLLNNHFHSNSTLSVILLPIINLPTMSTPPLTDTSAVSQAPNSASPTASLTQTIPHTTDWAVFKGNCHCGRYRFEYSLLRSFRLVDIAMRCTCTLCSMKGYIWLPCPSTPDEAKLTWTRDHGPLIKYESPLVADQVSAQ